MQRVLTERDLLQMILECAVVEVGSIEIQTDGMKELLEEYEIKYYTCEEEHKIRIDAIKK